jgi:mono/diheme cytochrome c family protein
MKIMNFTRLLAVTAILGTPVAIVAQQRPGNVNASASGPVTGNAVSGKQLYFNYACYSCHGYTGETGVIPFVPPVSPNLATETNFIAFLRGRANLAPMPPSTTMPNYAAKTLSDTQAKDIYAYIRSFKTNSPPADQNDTFKQIRLNAQKPYKP